MKQTHSKIFQGIKMISIRINLYCVLLLVALMGVPALGTTMQISWTGVVKAGFSTTFTCSSSCFPKCIYSWSFRGRTVNGSSLTWTPDGLDDTVTLQCIVFNPDTETSTSTTNIIQIKNPMSVRNNPPETLPSLNQSFNLLCYDAASGDPQGPARLVWYKDGKKMTLGENVHLLQNNLTLRFDSLKLSDAGFYQCGSDLPTLRTNVFSSVYQLSFDPWNVSISGPDVVFEGRPSEFTCLTSCTLNVDCAVRWTFRGGFPMGTYFSVHSNKLQWTPSIPGTLQNFTCVAENVAAGRSAEATKMTEVKGIPLSGFQPVQLNGLLELVLFMGIWSALYL